jgi:hypothetical protein
MALNEFTNIPSAATNPGAPIDAFLLRTLRTNSTAAETWLRAALATPFGPMGGFYPGTSTVTITGVPTDEHRCYMYNAKKVILDTALTTKDKVPLIWFATEEIELRNSITATGKGAKATETGNFGGSGGGAATAAADTKLPITDVTMKSGGAINAVGNTIDEFWASRVFQHLSGATGGGPGSGANGGAGGGIVILCAPKITFTGGGTKIIARGANGTANSGGGGGGTIILICHETNANVTLAKLEVNGGTGHGTAAAGIGGAGFAKIVTFT